MKQRFTLIELIVSVVVISILVAIVIPNVSSSKEDATIVAIRTDIRNLQVAVDSYALKHSEALPISGEVSRGVPQPINFSALHPDHIRNLPKTPDMKYWIDYLGVVYASTADAPTEVRMQGEDLLWNPSKNAKGYRIFTAETSLVQSSINAQDFKLVAEKKAQEKTTLKMLRPLPEGHTYYVSAIDRYGLETPVVKSRLIELAPPPLAEEEVAPEIQNSKPVARISRTPSSSVYLNTFVTWSSNLSEDPDGDNIVEREWKVNGVLTLNPNGAFSSLGTHVVELRVRDSRGMWSDWASQSVLIENRAPKAVIVMSPVTGAHVLTDIIWSHNSTDLDGDSIVGTEWKLDGVLKKNPNGRLSKGTHKIELRVQDRHGLWSPWVSKTFAVAEAPFYVQYDKEYGVQQEINHVYGAPTRAYLKIKGVDNMVGKKIKVVVSGKDMTPNVGFSYSNSSPTDRTKYTYEVTLDDSRGFAFGFNVTSSWFYIHSVELLN